MKVSLYCTDEEVRTKIDNLLHKQAAIIATLGTDSTEPEVLEVNSKVCFLNQEIAAIDQEFYESIS